MKIVEAPSDRRRFSILLLSWILVSLRALAIATPAQAQIIPDSTLPTNSTVSSPGCTACTIEGGTLRGVNLFHSFEQFSIPTGGSAWFNNAATVQNILTRVTGSSVSSIDGLLKANGSASFFLLNPNGILFGANARLDIGGSFLASTGSRFQFVDGSEFSATNPQAPPLLTINLTPGLQVGTSKVGATITSRGNLAVGQDLTLIGDRLDVQGQLQAGGDLTLQAQEVQIRDRATQPLTLQAGGNLLVQGNQTIDIFALNNPASGFFAGGKLVLRSANPVWGDAHYFSGGNFQIEQLDQQPGGLISPNDPIIRSQGDVSLAFYQGSSLHILAGGQVSITNFVNITGTDAIADTINPTATPQLANVTLSDGTPLVINGNARPTLDIRAGMAVGAIGTPLGTSGNGAGDFFFPAVPLNNPTATSANITIGQIQINRPNGQVFLTNQFQPNLNLAGGTIQVDDTNTSFVAGRAGDVVIDARGDFNLVPNALILAQGQIGGEIRLLSQGVISLTANVIGSVSLTSTPGLGGNVSLTAKQISAQDTFLINSTLGATQGGNLTLTATEAIDIGGTSIFTANTQGSGNAGNTTLNTQRLSVQTGAQVNNLTVSTAANAGKGGTFTVNASESVRLVGGLLLAQSQGAGDAGNLALETGQLVIQAGGQVTTATTATGVNAGSGGDIFVQAETVQVSGANSGLSASSLGGGDAGNLTINATQAVSISGNLNGNLVDLLGGNLVDPGGSSLSNLIAAAASIGFSGISAESLSTGKAGNVTINTQQLTAQNGAGISTTTLGGDAGKLTINATEKVQFDNALIGAATLGAGNAGDLLITTGTLTANQSIVFTTTAPIGTASGAGGDLTIDAKQSVQLNTSGFLTDTVGHATAGKLAITTQQLSLQNGSAISSATAGSGTGGNQFIRATEFVEVKDVGSGLFSSTGAGGGNAGDLTIETGKLSVRNGAGISASTSGTGDGGTIKINAAQLVEVVGRVGTTFSGIFSQTASGSQGNAGAVNIETRQLTTAGGGFISASTLGNGDSGLVTVVAKESVNLQGQFSGVATLSRGAGAAGGVLVVTDQFQIGDRAQILASTRDGAGGTITVIANQVAATSGAKLSTTTSGTGNAGSINVAAETIQLAGAGTGFFADTTSTATGKGGNITVTDAQQFTIQDRAGLAVGSQGAGEGGNLRVEANNLTLSNQAFLTAETASSNGGNIQIGASSLLLLRYNSLISATAGTAALGGNGGNIAIDAPFVIGVLSENSDIRANAFTGNGGNVTINANNIFGLKFQSFDTANSDITASSSFGFQGTVTLNTLNIDPSRGLTTLPGNLVDASNQVSQRCAARTRSGKNSFVVTGRGGLPASPEDTLTGLQPQVEVLAPVESVTSGKTGDRGTRKIADVPSDPEIIEARGWSRNPDGSVSLVTEAASPNGFWQTAPQCATMPLP